MPSVTILHVDDRPEDRARVAREIARDLPDARVLPIAGAAALQDALSQPVDLVITDHQLDWTDGLGVLACVNAEQPGIPVIMLTANGNEEVAVAGLKAGLDDYLPKSALHRLGGAIRTALDRAESRRRAATADAATRRAFERQRVVAEAARDFAAARHDVATIADRLARIAATTIGDLATVQIRLQEDISLALLAAHHPDPAIEARMRAHYEAAPIQRGEGLTGRILETGEPVVLNGKSTAEIQGQLKPEYRSFVEELGLTAVLAVPLQATGQVLGVVACARYDPNRPYSADDLLVLEELAGCAALALESAVLYLSAQEALRARDRVLSMATHELQTPLAAIKGLAQLLLRLEASNRLDPDRLRQGLRSIDESTDRLTRLVHDLLEVSRIRLGRLSLALEAVELSSLIQRIAARYASAGVTFQYGGGPAHVRADPARFEQVLTNVLDNAVKYSSPGTPIEVALSRDGAGFLVTVTDDGIGLPSGAAAAIFEPFSRAANAARSQRPGLGLGLFIARQIVELHAGTISAESPGEDQGTTIRIWLPAAPADSLPATDPLREHPS